MFLHDVFLTRNSLNRFNLLFVHAKHLYVYAIIPSPFILQTVNYDVLYIYIYNYIDTLIFYSENM